MDTGLSLDLDSHTYDYDGEPLPGVSEILTGLNYIDATYFTEWARERGTAVHAALEFYLCGQLDWTSIDPRIKGYVDAGVRFCEEAQVKDATPERSVWHPLYRYAGTPDLPCVAFGDPSLVDFKTGGLGLAALATAGYEAAERISRRSDVVRRRMAVQLFPDGRYKKTDFNMRDDYPNFFDSARLYRAFVMPRLKGAKRVNAAA